jgi:mono/diheme cytochrome c family protein
MRAPVETWTTPSTTAAVANHAFAAIPDENTDVIASVQVDSTLPSKTTDPTPVYDRRVSAAPETPRHRRVRLLVIPAALFIVVSATAFTLAKWHPATQSLPSSGPVKLGDPYHGQIDFESTCASCHGTGGKGGGVGPRLIGLKITLARAKAQIDGGGSVMPGGLVTGSKEQDVLAYLATILGKP